MKKSEKSIGLSYPSGMGRPWKIFHWLFVPKFFPGFYTCILTPKKNLGEKPNVKFFTVARYLEVISEVGLCESAKNETFCLFWPRRGCPRVKIKLEPLSIWGEGYLIQRRWNFDPPGPHKSFFRKKTCHSKYYVTYTYSFSNNLFTISFSRLKDCSGFLKKGQKVVSMY